jgi:hypothetical protein
MRGVVFFSIAACVLIVGCGSSTNPTASPTPQVVCCTPGPPTAATSQAPAVSTTPIESQGTPAPGPTTTATGSPAARLPQASEPVTLDPADFVSLIDNPWWPMAVGSKWTYRETDAEGGVAKIVVTVTGDTKEILGITATVAHDIATEDGQTVEDTFDWYAQDVDGNIWYLGEDTKEFSDGKIDTTGSWEAGVGGAYPGVVVPAAPQPGLSYRQEYLAGEAEDEATVLSLDEWVEVAAGGYRGLLLTKEFTPVEPDVLEYKWYAKGIGPVLALTVSGGSDREELTKFTP